MPETDLYRGIDTGSFRGHPVSLEFFEGPLDLLLYLVERERVEIWEISISRITKQYLDTLRSLEALNVEIAGEFLVMASTLMRIKSRQLLPTPPLDEEEGGGPAMTREELIRRLLEFRRYREAAASLRRLEEERRRCLPRGWTPSLPKDHLYPLREARVTDLALYLREVMQRGEEAPPTHEVQLEEIRLEEQVELLLRRVGGTDVPQRFHDLLQRPWWRLEWIVTFLAMLELARQGRIVVLQDEPFGDLWLVAAEPSSAAAAEREAETADPTRSAGTREGSGA